MGRWVGLKGEEGVATEVGGLKMSGDAEDVGLVGRAAGSLWARFEGLEWLRASSTPTGSWVRGAPLATGRGQASPEDGGGSSCEVMDNQFGGGGSEGSLGGAGKERSCHLPCTFGLEIALWVRWRHWL